jgi:hypothetical protein
VYYSSRMAMGKRTRARQPSMWVTTTDFPTAASHPFYTRLNQLLHQVEQLDQVTDAAQDPVALADEVVADEGCHSRALVLELSTHGFRTYISEPDRDGQSWIDQVDARDAVCGNRRRIPGDRGKRLLRRRGERIERTFAHAYETGGLRRTYLRGHANILKRVLVHVSGFNLGLVMRRLIGVGTPRGLQGHLRALLAWVVSLSWMMTALDGDRPRFAK